MESGENIQTNFNKVRGHAWNHEVKENIFKSKSLKMSIVDSVGTMILVSLHDTSESTCVWTVSDPLQIVRLFKSRKP